METVGKHLLLLQDGGARFEGNFGSLLVAKEFRATDAGSWTWGVTSSLYPAPLRVFDVARQRPETPFLGVDGHELHASFFQREGPVFSAGNDPDPADVCPTGRGGGCAHSSLSSHFCCEIH